MHTLQTEVRPLIHFQCIIHIQMGYKVKIAFENMLVVNRRSMI